LVITTCAAETPSDSMMPVGIPRPSSVTVTELSSWMITSMCVA
jgi:hypothetical protein